MPKTWKQYFNGIFDSITCNGPIVLANPVDANGVCHLIKDASGKTLLATGVTVPSNGGTQFAKGCLFIDTDVATGTSGLYVNKGTSSSCTFALVTNA